MDFIVVGAGAAFREHYAPALETMPDVNVVGIVDVGMPTDLPQYYQDAWRVSAPNEIPKACVRADVAVLILTPDHFSLIAQLLAMGFRFLMVEKPLVSRDEEVGRVMSLCRQYKAKIYATDFYIPKLFPLMRILGVISNADPRCKFVRASGDIDDAAERFGEVEGISVQVIEGGDFCLPDLQRRPWLRDPEIGGMLRDLGTHALSPLAAAGLLQYPFDIHQVDLCELSADTTTLVRIREPSHAEMYVSALITAKQGFPIQLSFGKVPLKGGVWSLVIRTSTGMFYAGLRTGHPSVLMPNGHPPMFFRLTDSMYRIVIEEAMMYFEDELYEFDGNLKAFWTASEVLQRLRFY